jgi:hypothetical protein
MRRPFAGPEWVSRITLGYIPWPVPSCWPGPAAAGADPEAAGPETAGPAESTVDATATPEAASSPATSAAAAPPTDILVSRIEPVPPKAFPAVTS